MDPLGQFRLVAAVLLTGPAFFVGCLGDKLQRRCVVSLAEEQVRKGLRFRVKVA